MEKQTIFNEYQEQTADDHNSLQDYTRDSIDHLIYDAVTQTKRFSGFGTQKTAQTEIQAAAGRFYDSDGAVYHYDTTLVQSMVSYLPSSSKRYVVLTVSGSESETDIETRDYLVDVTTRRTEPKAVATTSSRDAVLAFVTGTPAADPQVPSIPADCVAIAHILLDTLQVVSVTMQTANQVVSTEDLDERTDDLEEFKSAVEPRLTALASDLAALSAKIAAMSTGVQFDMKYIYQDLARLKENADLPQTYSDYGADNYMSTEHSDTDDSQQLGYHAAIDTGLRFPTFSNDDSEIALFSANDPNVINSSGLILPKFDSVEKIITGEKTSELGMSQYGYQSFELVQHQIVKYRLRYGCYWRHWYPHGDWYHHFWGLFPYVAWGTFYPWVLDFWPHCWNRYWYHYRPYCWVERYTEPYWELEKTDHNIEGAMVAQSFLVANDMWATQLSLYIAEDGGDANIFIDLCEITSGVPDLSKTIMHIVYDYSDITVGWNDIPIMPTFMKSGTRYAMVCTSEANHKVGMTSGQSYLDGTFFYSTDGAFYLGDLTKDMMIKVWGAEFDSPQVTAEFAPMSLSGGIRAIDLLVSTVIPESADLIYEIRVPDGDWMALTPENIEALTSAPPLFQFRGRWVGTRDIAAGLLTTGSHCNISRPDTTFRHVSDPWTLSGGRSGIVVQLTLNDFNETPHDCTCRIFVDTAYHNPNTTGDETVDSINNVIKRTFSFTGLSPTISAFTIEVNGSTNSAANLFSVAEMLFWATP